MVYFESIYLCGWFEALDKAHEASNAKLDEYPIHNSRFIKPLVLNNGRHITLDIRITVFGIKERLVSIYRNGYEWKYANNGERCREKWCKLKCNSMSDK